MTVPEPTIVPQGKASQRAAQIILDHMEARLDYGDACALKYIIGADWCNVSYLNMTICIGYIADENTPIAIVRLNVDHRWNPPLGLVPSVRVMFTCVTSPSVHHALQIITFYNDVAVLLIALEEYHNSIYIETNEEYAKKQLNQKEIDDQKLNTAER
jgi:hypothetical protein